MSKMCQQIRAWQPYLLIDGHKKVEEDLEYLLPVRFGEILCSGCRGDVENVSANQSPRRPYLLTDRHEKHKLGKGPWVLASCKVSWNSEQQMQRRCRKCVSLSEPSTAIFVGWSARKTQSNGRGPWVLSPCNVSWNSASDCRGDVENFSANQSPRRPYLLTDRHEKHKLGRGP